eukprot:TRINITY_DN5948_c0_g1_i1.p1 TRINITY_DN5948_c0_g1~~TRINITY_DN5948_c0_g1_i1.p1  ORF type:complete len:2102 (-),score=505.44 TRINITY_DN5948_c0_g1_i1:50-6355(-)
MAFNPAALAAQGAAGLLWVPSEEHGWLPSRLCRVDGSEAVFVSGGSVCSTSGGSSADVPVSCAAELLPTLGHVQEQQLEGVDDICSLSTVTEAALLHTIRVRYARSQIYTRVSRILIAVNPFQALQIYTGQYLNEYAQAQDSLDLPPHIFGTGHDALCGLREGTRDQAIVISGESGAGKTESAKLLLRYVAEVVRSSSSSSSATPADDSQPRARGLEEKVMQTNPVLEAFGNAMTVRNNNSSRFGKWLDMRFSTALGMLGCRITSYLLEVTRVCTQSSGERGYHIFFQLLQARASPFLADLRLQDMNSYRYLRGSVPVAPGVDDGLCFKDVRVALTSLGFGDEEQLGIFRIVSGALALGNCDFLQQADGQSEELRLDDDAHAQRAADLFQVDPQGLARCLLWRKVVTGKDVTETPLREEQARAVRDGLSRMLYGQLFEWLIRRMNRQLHAEDGGETPSSPTLEAEGLAAAQRGDDRLLGILDISGFESFERNSLEQLLINLSNEHLQKQFNDDVFKSELEDCAKEGICLKSQINYADNSDVLSLLDGKAGVLDMLDEEITMPKATDTTFHTKVLRELAKQPCLIAPKFAGTVFFGVRHYAGVVTYACDGFLEKNADRLPSEEAVELLAASKLSVMREIAFTLKERFAAVNSKAKRRASATSRFRTSLKSLMTKIAAADNHYVRCIKPNSLKVPNKFMSPMVHEQLLFSGVLEAVRIRQQGYASRLPFRGFVLRYRCVVTVRIPGAHTGARPLAVQSASEEGAKELVQRLRAVLPADQVAENDIVFGKTKVFMRTTVAAILEALRAQACMSAVALIQRQLRGAHVRRRFSAVKPLAREVYAWLSRWCPEGSWQKGALLISCMQRLGTFEVAETELARLDALLHLGATAPLQFGALHRARVAREKLHAEVEILRYCRSLLTTGCVDTEAMDAALAHVGSLGMPATTDVQALATRAERVKAQLPIVTALQQTAASKDLSQVPTIMQMVERAGLFADRSAWIAELQGERLLFEVIRLVEVDKALKQVRALLEGGSVDLAAMDAALAMAQQWDLGQVAEVIALNARAAAVRLQKPFVDALQQMIASGDLSQYPAIVESIHQAGLIQAPANWIPELGGAKLLEEATRLVEVQKVLHTITGLLESSSMDLPAIGQALQRAAELDLGASTEVVQLSTRLQRLQVQIPLVQTLRQMMESGDFTAFPQVMQAVEQAGLLVDRAAWLPELDGERLFASVMRSAEAEKTMHEVKLLLQSGSLDPEALNKTLVRAGYAGLDETPEVLALRQWDEKVKVQVPLVQKFRVLLQGPAGEAKAEVPALVKQLEALGLLANPGAWIPQLDGARLQAEVLRTWENGEALAKVSQLLELRTVDVAQMASALQQAAQLGLGTSETTRALATRMEKVQTQLPLVKALQDVVTSGNTSHLPGVMAKIKEMGLLANRQEWIQELGGDALLTEAGRMTEMENTLRTARQLLDSCTLDTIKMNEVLSQAKSLGLPDTNDLLRLAERSKKVQAQLPIANALRNVINTGKMEQLPRVLCDLQREGLDAAPERWVPELEGRMLYSQVMAAAEKQNKTAQIQEETKKLFAAKELKDRAHHAAQHAAGKDAGPSQQRNGQQSAADAALGRPPAPAGADMVNGQHAAVPEGGEGEGSEGIDEATMAKLGERLRGVAEKIAGTSLAQKLNVIAEALHATEKATADSLKGLATDLTALADRLRGVPMGNDLLDIAQGIRTEVAKLTNRNRGLSVCMLDTSGLSAEELRRTVARLEEERLELRRALQGALLEAVEREEALIAECTTLRRELAAATPEAMQAQFSVALEEESRAARAARAHLTSENERLQEELGAEKLTSNALRAELAAVRAMKNLPLMNGKNHGDGHTPLPSARGAKLGSTPRSGPDDSAAVPKLVTAPTPESMTAEAQQEKPLVMPRTEGMPQALSDFISERGVPATSVSPYRPSMPFGGEKPGGGGMDLDMPSEADVALRRPRRQMDFVCRDFFDTPAADRVELPAAAPLSEGQRLPFSTRDTAPAPPAAPTPAGGWVAASVADSATTAAGLAHANAHSNHDGLQQFSLCDSDEDDDLYKAADSWRGHARGSAGHSTPTNGTVL